MVRLLPPLLVVAAAVLVSATRADVSRPQAKDAAPPAGLPVGKWKVQFANGVVETVDVGNGGECSVEEPRRRSGGTAEVKDGSVVLTFADDRVERWTPVGTRYVVEHWFPASRVPIVTPVLGIADQSP